MTTFEDGPAKGQKLLLHRAPRFLRVTCDGEHWDVLDQLEDVPKASEKLFAYELTTNPGMCHINAGKRSGFYTIANYRLITEQPTNLVMRCRDNEAWRQWCLDEQQRRPWPS
jgi:hypothetical protein